MKKQSIELYCSPLFLQEVPEKSLDFGEGIRKQSMQPCALLATCSNASDIIELSCSHMHCTLQCQNVFLQEVKEVRKSARA